MVIRAIVITEEIIKRSFLLKHPLRIYWLIRKKISQVNKTTYSSCVVTLLNAIEKDNEENIR
ncbi:hypothetical protein CA163_20660 [Vibrio parahaemolyticus]|uniref:Uncharacterized protein n=1 Tax=Vibrio parahaemolyticus TaxID=670 RepID=A0A227J9B9_VIBPH|nr:hypothetical protein CA163_20660 [Vibrio parahaemolyticus]